MTKTLILQHGAQSLIYVPLQEDVAEQFQVSRYKKNLRKQFYDKL